VTTTYETEQGSSPEQAEPSQPNLRVDLFVDPACWWSFLTYRLLIQAAPHRQLDLHLRPYSLLLRAAQEHLEDWKVTVWGASLRAVRVMQAVEATDPTGVRPFYQAIIARGITAFREGRIPFGDIDAALRAAGLPPGYATAADDAERDEQIRRSMDEASAAVGEGVGTPALVLQQNRPVGVLGPVVAGPTTEAEALRVWDAVVAFLAAPSLLELSRPRPRPAIPS
jgi:hypothetical protein